MASETRLGFRKLEVVGRMCRERVKAYGVLGGSGDSPRCLGNQSDAC